MNGSLKWTVIDITMSDSKNTIIKINLTLINNEILILIVRLYLHNLSLFEVNKMKINY